METLNRVELVGVVGNVRHTPVGANSHAYNFSVATNYAYHGADGSPVIETTWHKCYLVTEDEQDINRGDTIRVSGRLQAQKFITFSGIETETWRIIVRTLRVIKKSDL